MTTGYVRSSVPYIEFYNKDRGLPEPVWGDKARTFKGKPLQCPRCGSTDMYYSASLDDPEEIFQDFVRCKHCGSITDWYEAHKQRVTHPVDVPMEVFRPENTKKGGTTMQAYCVKCKEKRDVKNPRSIVMKNGRPAVKGECATCGTKMFRIGTTTA